MDIENSSQELVVEDHQRSLLLQLHELKKGDHFCDVTLVGTDGCVRAHGALLMAASPYLRQRWISRELPVESSELPKSLIFSHVKVSVLDCVVDFIYTGVLNVTVDSLSDVLELCTELKLDEAVRVCQANIKVKSEINEKQTAAEIEIEATVSSPLMPDSPLDTHVISDHYEDSTDVENVVKVKSEEKQRSLRKSRVRNNSAFANKNRKEKSLQQEMKPLDDKKELKDSRKENRSLQNEVKTSGNTDKKKQKDNRREKKTLQQVVQTVGGNKEQKDCRKEKRSSQQTVETEGDKKEQKDNRKEKRSLHELDARMKTLKVPKLSICFKQKKNGEEGKRQTKVRKPKQSHSGRDRKQRKNSKITELYDTKEKDTTDAETIVKQEEDSDLEEDSAIDMTIQDSNSEKTEDQVNSHLKKDEINVTEPSLEDKVFPEECHLCEETFEDMKSYSKHIKTHNKKTKSSQRRNKQEVWPCSVCGRKLTTAVRQACHHYSKHGIPYDESLKLHACDVQGCKYVTASSHYLQIHKKGRHGNERPHVCEFCGKGFKLPSALVTHLNIHTNTKVYKCEECNLTFNQKGGLDIHEKKHHKGEASWTELCHLCSEKFLQKAELSWHMYTVHQIPLPDRYKVYSCELCDYQTIRRNKLERHQDAHNDNRSWTCDICGKKFVTKSYLNRHLRYHGEKSFKCTFDGCNYACVDNIGLKKHVRLMHTHKNYKPFVCSLCHYKTGLRGNLDKHIRTVHQLDVVTKHTVHLKMKFKDRQSGDILTKDGQLINMIEDHRGEDPRRLQAMLADGDDDEEDMEDKPIDMIMKDGIIYTSSLNAGEKPAEEDNSSQDSEQKATNSTTSTSQSTTFPYVYNGMQYLTPVTQIPYTMVPLPQGEMYTTIDPMTLTAAKFSEFY